MRLEELPAQCSFRAFRSMRMKSAWLADTRTDCLFEISQLAQRKRRWREREVRGAEVGREQDGCGLYTVARARVHASSAMCQDRVKFIPFIRFTFQPTAVSAAE